MWCKHGIEECTNQIMLAASISHTNKEKTMFRKCFDYGFFAFSCIVEVEPLMGREFSKNSHFLD